MYNLTTKLSNIKASVLVSAKYAKTLPRKPYTILKITIASLAILTLTGVAIAALPTNTPAHDHGVITFIGDSNIVHSAASVVTALSWRNDPYNPIFLGRTGAAVRWPDCPLISNLYPDQSCPTQNLWGIILPDEIARVKSDAFVINLGINDSNWLGTCTTWGYACFSQKIDYMMRLLPSTTPVIWTNLPCAIEPVDHRVGCNIVDFSLALAHARWPNLTVLNWSAVATPHPEWMAGVAGNTGVVHYTTAGYNAWTALVMNKLDATLQP